ncbi:phage DNA packaging Nu1 protein [Rhizobium sp. Kim5]|nr:phage DNA packaging Nu1 protein [Rhizobium sp. Kim5]
MTRRKSAERVLKSSDKAENFSSPAPELPDDSAPPSAKREAAKLRIVSVKQAATLLNRDRNTVQKWLDKGCPYVTKADRELGISWELDLGDVVRWLEDRAGEIAAERFGASEDGKTSEDEAKRRRAVAQAVVAELDMLERLRSVIPIADVLDLWSTDYAAIRDKLMSIPDLIAANVDPAIASHVSGIAEKHIRNVLAKLKTEGKLLKPE